VKAHLKEINKGQLPKEALDQGLLQTAPAKGTGRSHIARSRAREEEGTRERFTSSPAALAGKRHSVKKMENSERRSGMSTTQAAQRSEQRPHPQSTGKKDRGHTDRVSDRSTSPDRASIN